MYLKIWIKNYPKFRDVICGRHQKGTNLFTGHPAGIGPEGQFHLEAVDEGERQAEEGVEPVTERSLDLIAVRVTIPTEMPFT